MIPSGSMAGQRLLVEAEEPAEDLLVVLAEGRGRGRRRGSGPVEAGIGSLLQVRPGHRVIDLGRGRRGRPCGGRR